MKVKFNYADRKLLFSPKSTLKELVKTIFFTETIEVNRVDYIFCSDQYLLEINQNILNHDYYTDIITFPLQDKGMPIKSEIYISLDRVKENAATHNTSPRKEIARVIAHGALHLCGYKDKSRKEKIKMREKEAFYIQHI